MKRMSKRWTSISLVLLVSILSILVGMASAETYVITGGGAIVTVDAPLVDLSSAGGLSGAIGDIAIAKTDTATSPGAASSSGSASAQTEDGPAFSKTVSWANIQDTSAGYAYSLAIAIPDESGNVALTDANVAVDGSVSGFAIDAEGSAEVVK